MTFHHSLDIVTPHASGWEVTNDAEALPERTSTIAGAVGDDPIRHRVHALSEVHPDR